MKKILTSMSFLVLSITVCGQAQESMIPQFSYVAGSIAAAKIDLPYSPQVVIEVIKQYGKAGGNSNQRKAVGYQLFENTQLIINNHNSADLHYYVQLKNSNNPNETELYLKLKSFTQDKNNRQIEYYFNMKEAIDYLNNLQKAVAQEATVLQMQLQNNNLAKCKKRIAFLEKEAVRLNRQQDQIMSGINKDQSVQKKSRQTQKLYDHNQKVDNNRIMLANQKMETLKQAKALALLLNPTRN